MKKKMAFCSNHYYLLYGERVIGMVIDEKEIILGDRVRVAADSHGYITPGISHAGYGQIVDIATDNTDHYFGVLMDSGEYGYLKRARISEIIPRKY